MTFPQGSLDDLCRCSGDWECYLEIDYFHARIHVESLTKILGNIDTVIGGAKVFPKRNFPVVCNVYGTTRVAIHLDLVCHLPFRIQLYFHDNQDAASARTIITDMFTEHGCHRVKPNPRGANLCEGPVMVPTWILVESLRKVQSILTCDIFLNQYGCKKLWLDFQVQFKDVFIPDRNNLWDLTINMRHKEGHIIMFRRNGITGAITCTTIQLFYSTL